MPRTLLADGSPFLVLPGAFSAVWPEVFVSSIRPMTSLACGEGLFAESVETMPARELVTLRACSLKCGTFLSTLFDFLPE